MRGYNVRVNGRTYGVSAESLRKGSFRVALDGEIFESVSLSDTDGSTWIVRAGEETIRARCRVLQDGNVDVWIAGLPFSSAVQGATPTWSHDSQPSGRGNVGGEIRALMPGRVTSVLVNEGEIVKPGDPLLIFEAMKMLNEISSPFAGHVVRVYVKEGETVRKDAILVVVE